jgi:hypothetical protein
LIWLTDGAVVVLWKIVPLVIRGRSNLTSLMIPWMMRSLLHPFVLHPFVPPLLMILF